MRAEGVPALTAEGPSRRCLSPSAPGPAPHLRTGGVLPSSELRSERPEIGVCCVDMGWPRGRMTAAKSQGPKARALFPTSRGRMVGGAGSPVPKRSAHLRPTSPSAGDQAAPTPLPAFRPSRRGVGVCTLAEQGYPELRTGVASTRPCFVPKGRPGFLFGLVFAEGHRFRWVWPGPLLVS